MLRLNIHEVQVLSGEGNMAHNMGKKESHCILCDQRQIVARLKTEQWIFNKLRKGQHLLPLLPKCEKEKSE